MTVKVIDQGNFHHSPETLYEVISITFILEDGFWTPRFRIMSNQGIPIVIPNNLIIIIESSIPKDYILIHHSPNACELIPFQFKSCGFWENFYDSESDAINIFLKRFPKYKGKIW